METNLTRGNSPKLDLFSVYRHWNWSLGQGLKFYERYTQEHHRLYHTKQLLELRHGIFQGFHPRNHSHLCLLTNRIITPQKIYSGTTQPKAKPNIIISPADKYGDVVIINKQRYVDKFNSFLEDTDFYEISNLTTMNKDIISFNKLFKGNVKNQNTRTSLIEHHSKTPTLYDLPKIHKPNTPLRSIFPASVVPPTKQIAQSL